MWEMAAVVDVLEWKRAGLFTMDESTARSRHPDFIRQAFLWALLPTLLLVLNAPDPTYAQVATNITSTTGAGNLGTTVTQAGNLYNVTGGTRPGSGPNLFHSFGDFSVGGGEIANFLNDTGLPTSNILGRVTGGNISNIDGTIQTTDFGNANLFLVNPSGIVFGPNGSVNVGGSVSFTTAQYLRLFDGVNSANFYANTANDGLVNSVLAVAPVADFGFLSPAAYGFLTAPDPSATITVQGSALSVPSGQSISLVGGNVVIQAATLPDQTVQRAQLSAPNGTIQLASAASPGEFAPPQFTPPEFSTMLQAFPNVDGASFTSFGSIALYGSNPQEFPASIDVSGARTVFVKSGQLVLSVNDATLSTSESPAPQDTIVLSSGKSIMTSNSGIEPGADVQITVGTLQMETENASVETINTGDGTGGNISINASTITATFAGAPLPFVFSSTGMDYSTGEFVGSGNGGNVTVQGLGGPGSPADSVALSLSGIQTVTFGPGRGGNVQLTAGTLTMENFSSTLTATSGGGVAGGGVGGDMVLNVGKATIIGGSGIRTSSLNHTEGVNPTHGLGQGGNVTIQGLQGVGSAAESVALSWGSIVGTFTSDLTDGGQVAITSRSLTMDGNSGVSAFAADVGHGGDIVLSVQHARLSGSSIRAQNSSTQVGPAVTVQGLQGAGSMADSVIFSGSNSGIITDTQGTAHTGDVAVFAKTVSLADGAVIQAGTPSTTAAGGDVTIDAGSVGISGGSHVSSQSAALDAGQVTITANALTLDKGSIETNANGLGRGGDVVLYGKYESC